jgi:hypothetical protein
MASDETTPLEAEQTEDDVHTNLSAACSVHANSLSATGSAIGVASVDGDATITSSFAPAVLARGNASLHQSYTSAVIVGGANTSVNQAFAPLIVGKTMDLTQTGSAVLVTGEANVKHSWVGIVVAPNATVSEDSHILVSTRGASVIAAALFGGLVMVALAIMFGARSRGPQRPTMSHPSLPDFHALQDKLRHMREHPGASIPALASMRSLPCFSALQERWMHRKA